MLFADLLRDKKLQLKGKIVDADLEMYKKRLPPNRYVKKLLVKYPLIMMLYYHW